MELCLGLDKEGRKSLACLETSPASAVPGFSVVPAELASAVADALASAAECKRTAGVIHQQKRDELDRDVTCLPWLCSMCQHLQTLGGAANMVCLAIA